MNERSRASVLSTATLTVFCASLAIVYALVTLWLHPASSPLPWILCAFTAVLTAPMLLTITWRNHRIVAAGHRPQRVPAGVLVRPALLIAATGIPTVLTLGWFAAGDLSWAASASPFALMGLFFSTRLLIRRLSKIDNGEPVPAAQHLSAPRLSIGKDVP